jgi:alpha-glucosidase
MAELKWWQKAVFYQIYPRSFADGNGDGIGDLRGMIQQLDYLRDLGIDALWLSPHYPSPQFDCGYDIADYTDVAPEYGTLDDFREFLDGAHQRGIRVILDLVLNHTSHQHRWFIESSSSRDNPKRDWYIWRDGRDGGPPNNWCSTFGGSAWEYDARTGQYYYHFFFKQQPDLNWRSPEVKQAMWDAVRFWLDMGVDGFRLDAIGTIFERPDLPDHTATKTLVELMAAREIPSGPLDAADLANEWGAMFGYQVEQPGMHELMQELRTVLDEYVDRVLVGENEEIVYHGHGDDELHMVFNFPLMKTKRLTPAWIRANQRERLAELAKISLDAWPCNTLGNHDSPRVKSRYGDGAHDDELARVHLALMLTLRGTPFLYNGEEIGMTDLFLDDVAQFRDQVGIWAYHVVRDELKLPEEFARKRAAQATRDMGRTPLQWANGPNAGFSPASVVTWLPVNPNYALGVNVADQEDDPGSLLNFYRRMLRLRKQTPALIAGDYTPLHEAAADYLAFLRHTNAVPLKGAGQTCLIVLNFTEGSHTLCFDPKHRTARRLFSSSVRDGATDDVSQLGIGPFEIYIGEVISSQS